MQHIVKPLHHELKQAYGAESVGDYKYFLPLCPLVDRHPGAYHAFFLYIYTARNNTKITTQSQYT
jgi:hypothetical protein